MQVHPVYGHVNSNLDRNSISSPFSDWYDSESDSMHSDSQRESCVIGCYRPQLIMECWKFIKWILCEQVYGRMECWSQSNKNKWITIQYIGIRIQSHSNWKNQQPQKKPENLNIHKSQFDSQLQPYWTCTNQAIKRWGYAEQKTIPKKIGDNRIHGKSTTPAQQPTQIECKNQIDIPLALEIFIWLDFTASTDELVAYERLMIIKLRRELNQSD